MHNRAGWCLLPWMDGSHICQTRLINVMWTCCQCSTQLRCWPTCLTLRPDITQAGHGAKSLLRLSNPILSGFYITLYWTTCLTLCCGIHKVPAQQKLPQQVCRSYFFCLCASYTRGWRHYAFRLFFCTFHSREQAISGTPFLGRRCGKTLQACFWPELKNSYTNYDNVSHTEQNRRAD